ncbi:MAG: VOC family protein, partial [Anaerolineales bacterium]|nr:VOC family protein [Anaerolineales bacterium]
MNVHEKMNYVELPATNIEATKAFFTAAFGWTFTDYGPEYTAFDDEGLDGGFYQSDLTATVAKGSALIVFYSAALEETQAKIEEAGGAITRPIFSFPGG